MDCPRLVRRRVVPSGILRNHASARNRSTVEYYSRRAILRRCSEVCAYLPSASRLVVSNRATSMHSILQEALEHPDEGVTARTVRWLACGDLSGGSAQVVSSVTNGPRYSRTASRSGARPRLSLDPSGECNSHTPEFGLRWLTGLSNLQP